MPTSAVWEAGPLTELPVSVPNPTSAKLAATPACDTSYQSLLRDAMQPVT